MLRLLTNFLVASQLSDSKLSTISDHLLNLRLDDAMEMSMNKLVTDGKIKSQSIVDLLDTSDDERDNRAVDILFKLLASLFETHRGFADGVKVHEHTCKALCLLLKTSPHVRQLATDEAFIVKIASQMEDICDKIGANCQDFVRKHGNAKVSGDALR